MLKLMVDEYGDLPSFGKEDFIQYHMEHVSYGRSSVYGAAQA